MNGKMAKSLKKELLRGDEELIQNLRKLIGIGKTVLFKREQYYKYLKKYAPMAEKFFKSMISDKNSVMLKADISTIYETT